MTLCKLLYTNHYPLKYEDIAVQLRKKYKVKLRRKEFPKYLCIYTMKTTLFFLKVKFKKATRFNIPLRYPCRGQTSKE